MTAIHNSRSRARQPTTRTAGGGVETSVPRGELAPPVSPGTGDMATDRGLRRLLDQPSSSTARGADSVNSGLNPLNARLSAIDGAGADRAGLAGSPALKRALRAGRRVRKSDAAEGNERLLSDRHRRRIRELIATLPASVAAQLRSGLEGIQGPAPALAGAIYLKAAAARSDALLGDKPQQRSLALQTLAAFARRLDGLSAAELRSKASVLDLDADTNTSSFDAMGWDEKRGVMHARGDGDTRSDNDGLLQRFTGSCGSTTLQMALCEEDPVRAFVVHDAGLGSVDARDVVARYQAEVLVESGAAALGRAANYNLARLRNGLGRLKRSGQVNAADADALAAYASEKGPLNRPAKRALEALRELAAGFPSPTELRRLRTDPLKGHEGLTNLEFEATLNSHLSPITGARYELLKPPDGLALGELADHLDHLEQILARGADVPIGISEPGHFMFISAVREHEGERQFLVSCGWGGITAWVDEASLVAGDFIASPFDLAYPDKCGHIDAVFLARADG